MSVRYAVIFEQARNNRAPYVPDLPGCITTGATLEDTERNIREAIEGHLKTLRQFGAQVPSSGHGRAGRGDCLGAILSLDFKASIADLVTLIRLRLKLMPPDETPPRVV